MLLIAYHFPPSAAVGGQRIVNFATRLQSLGWKPRVLTIPESAVERIDKGRLAEVNGLTVHQASVWPTALGVLTALNKFRHRTASSESPAPVSLAAGGAQGTSRSESFVRRLRRYVFSFAFLPDSEKGWIVPATVEAVRTIRRHKLGWFMTSCPPYSVHLIGLAVKKLTGARWVADFRDPWMTTGSKRLYPTCAASIGIESWLERRVIENADLVVFNVDRLRNAYRGRYSHLPPDKFVYIPNGVASRKVVAASAPKYDRFTISYTGSLYVGRSPEPVFRALSRMIQSGVLAPDAVRIKLVGQCRFIDGLPTDVVVRNHGLESVVEVHDSVPHREAVEIVQRSHLALLLAPNLPYQVPAKVYDYFSTGTRILGIAEEGGTADLLRETNTGSAFAGDDVDGIADFIRCELTGAAGAARRPASLERLDVQRLTEELVTHLERC